MKVSTLLIISSLLIFSCSAEKTTDQQNADAMVAEALATAKKIEAEAKAKGEALATKAVANVKRKREEKAVTKMQTAATRAVAEQRNAALQHMPNKALSKYNGFYLENRNNSGALIFIDGKLTYFNCADFKAIYKNEEYNVAGLTDDNFFDITAKYYKNRKGEVGIKETVLRDVKPTIANGICIQLERGWTYQRIATFRAFMKTRSRYSMEDFTADYKAKYKRSDVEIQKGLDNPAFYKCAFFATAPFYGDQMPLIDALESIIQK